MAGALLSLVTALSTGCGGGDAGEPEAIETVDISPEIDAQLRLEEDTKQKRHAPEIRGVLPSDVPTDVWLYRPSSIVDLGDVAQGHFVTLKVPEPIGPARSALQRGMSSKGWRLESSDNERFAYAKDGRTVRWILENRQTETWMRLEY